MNSNNKPEKLDKFMLGLMKNAKSYSLLNFLDYNGISEEEYDEIVLWFRDELGIKF